MVCMMGLPGHGPMVNYKKLLGCDYMKQVILGLLDSVDEECFPDRFRISSYQKSYDVIRYVTLKPHQTLISCTSYLIEGRNAQDNQWVNYKTDEDYLNC